MKTLTSDRLTFNNRCAPHQHGPNDTGRIMLWVIAACIPAIITATWFFGYGMLLNILQCGFWAALLETIVARLRRQVWNGLLRDNSALVSAILLGISLPPGSVWWLVLLGMVFALLVAKHAFGGLGHNPFNPAMCGYVMLLLSFPLQMTAWHIPMAEIRYDPLFSPLQFESLTTSIALAFPFLAPGPVADFRAVADGLVMATPLIEQKLAGNSAVFAALDSGNSLFSRSSGTGWELINLGFLLGGLLLLFRKIISWHIPVSVIAAVAVMSILFYSDKSMNVVGSTYLHLFGSATMIGAFFIATDPVSAATTPVGKIVYGLLIGGVIYWIRVWGSYLDAVAFAVLVGNFCAPLIDQLTLPRIYGHYRRTGPWK
ncbi:MAG: RnfABCDGE type electron transport complex subunit D [Pseudohongiellaceae bacterium]